MLFDNQATMQTDSRLDTDLDIETTGLFCQYTETTGIGICPVNGSDSRLVQLVRKEVRKNNLLEALGGVQTIYTYDSWYFDVPSVHGSLDIDLATSFSHHDPMYSYWKRSLFSSLKMMKQQLGILPQSKGIGDWDAIVL